MLHGHILPRSWDLKCFSYCKRPQNYSMKRVTYLVVDLFGYVVKITVDSRLAHDKIAVIDRTSSWEPVLQGIGS